MTALSLTLDDEQTQLREMARKLAGDVYAPKAYEWDRDRTPLPDEERRRLADLDLLGITLPEQYGGAGRPLIDALLVIEELAKGSALAAWPTFEGSTGPARVVDLFGTEEQKERFLPPVARGEMTIAVSISEADAGSAATDMTTVGRDRGRRDRHQRDEALVLGRRPRRAVPRLPAPRRRARAAGHRRRDRRPRRAGPDLRPAGAADGLPRRRLGRPVLRRRARPGREHDRRQGGFRQLFTAFSIERLGNATMSLAIGQARSSATAAYIQERKQFGRELGGVPDGAGASSPTW